MDYFVIYVCAINIIAFLLYGLDKQKAKMNRWRISEKVLLGIAIVGGSIGAYVGMKAFRHKTKKARFYIGVPVIFLLQLTAILYLSMQF